MNPFFSLSRLLLAIVAMGLMSSCAGAKFNRDWNQAVAAYQSEDSGAKDPVAGPWTGSWLSHVNSHTGDLRCLVTPKESAGKNTYEFRYHATWQKILSGGFTAEYDVEPQGRRGYLVKGDKDLGPFGGFQHEGRIVGDTFDSTYASDMGDHGVFELKRP